MTIVSRGNDGSRLTMKIYSQGDKGEEKDASRVTTSMSLPNEASTVARERFLVSLSETRVKMLVLDPPSVFQQALTV